MDKQDAIEQGAAPTVTSEELSTFDVALEESLSIISSTSAVDSIVDKSSTAPEIFVDDVHKALSTLQSSAGVHKNDKESEEIVNLTKKLAHATALLGKRNERELQNQLSEDERKAKRERIQSLKARTKCNACGKIGHWAGDKQCELRNEDHGKGRGRRRNREDLTMEDDEEKENEKSPFQRRGQ